MVNIAGIAKYAFKTHVLTLFIMVSNFIVLVYRLTSIVYLLCRNGDEITEKNASNSETVEAPKDNVQKVKNEEEKSESSGENFPVT